MESGSLHPVTAAMSRSRNPVPSFQASPRVLGSLRALVAFGGLTLLAGSLLAPERTWANLLLASYYVLTLGLGGVLLIAIEYATGAGWSVAFRRIPEAMAKTLPAGALLFVAVLIVSPRLYPWFHEVHTGADTTAWFREAWLTPWFFFLRAAVYLAAWIFFAHKIVANSRRQDADGDPRCRQANVRLSAAFLVVFGLTLSGASFDWIMSLEPHWYSTIFGVYHFAGLILTALAMTTIVVIWLERLGPLRGVLTKEHLHDLGKLLFAFSTFWMYIWFSQYMLIWYANIPEETVYYARRLQGFWEPVFLLNVLLNWVAPFFMLLSVRAKRSSGLMMKAAWVILVGRWVDLYGMILPPLTKGDPAFGIWEIGIIAGAAGVFFLALIRNLGAAAVVPRADPLLEESLHYHN